MTLFARCCCCHLSLFATVVDCNGGGGGAGGGTGTGVLGAHDGKSEGPAEEAKLGAVVKGVLELWVCEFVIWGGLIVGRYSVQEGPGKSCAPCIGVWMCTV